MSYSLSFTKSIMVVIFISDKVRQEQFEYLSTAMISKILEIPKPTLVKILHNLSGARIIETKEGKSGGIRLLKRSEDITVLDILKAMENGKPLFQTTINVLAEGKRPDNARRAIKLILTKAEHEMRKSLNSKTIYEILCDMND